MTGSEPTSGDLRDQARLAHTAATTEYMAARQAYEAASERMAMAELVFTQTQCRKPLIHRGPQLGAKAQRHCVHPRLHEGACQDLYEVEL